ncbi:MAG: peptidylprolyl isomerase [Phycisphaerae bacterium]
MRGVMSLVLLFSLAADLSAQTKTVRDLFENSDIPSNQTAAAVVPGTDSRAIAQVNGRDVSRQEFFKILYSSSGVRVVRQMIGLELAKQMAAAEGIALSKGDIDQEFHAVVDQLGPQKDNLGKDLSFNDRQRLLRAILERRGISFDEFQVGIRQQGYLRAIARKKVKVTGELVKEEYEQAYGKRRKARVIVVQDIKIGEEVYNRLQKGENFAALAGKYSIDFTSAPVGGQIGEVAPKDPRFPAVVVKTIFTLAIDKVSSPVKVNDQFWIIKVDQEVLPMPISFDKVHDQLTRQVSSRLENQMMEKIQTELFKSAKITVHDNLLSKEFASWIKELRANE